MKWTKVIEVLEDEIERHELELADIAEESARRHALTNPWYKEDGETYDEELRCTVMDHEEHVEALRISLECVRGSIAKGYTQVFLNKEDAL
jgi:hypothetical protein